VYFVKIRGWLYYTVFCSVNMLKTEKLVAGLNLELGTIGTYLLVKNNKRGVIF